MIITNIAKLVREEDIPNIIAGGRKNEIDRAYQKYLDISNKKLVSAMPDDVEKELLKIIGAT